MCQTLIKVNQLLKNSNGGATLWKWRCCEISFSGSKSPVTKIEVEPRTVHSFGWLTLIFLLREITLDKTEYLKAYSQFWDNFWKTKVLWQRWKIVFCFNLTSVFVLKIFNFFLDFFGNVEKWLDMKDKVNFKI